MEEAKKNPEKLRALAKEVTAGLPQPALVSDAMTYRIVVIALGAVAVGGIGGAIALSVLGNEIPEVLTALGAAAIGALAGILTPLSR